MSSAILYVAIVAIWVCVLIPRWLRRDSVRGAAPTAGVAIRGEAGFADPADGDSVAFGPDDDRGEDSLVQASTVQASTVQASTVQASTVQAGTVQAGTVQPGDFAEALRPAPVPMTAEESRRRMLKARRRLLILLVLLEATAVTLATLGLAATWVVAPPSVMLFGYLLLLREAAQADAERAHLEADAQARSRARDRDRARAARRTVTAGSAAVAPAAGPSVVAAFAAAPVPADYEDSGPGRDFAPGLAGKYTPSYPEPNPADEDYDTYDHPRLRAVGD